MIPISQVIKLRLRGIKPFIPRHPAHRQWNWDPHPSWADSKAHALDCKGLWVSKRASSPWNQHLQGLPDQQGGGAGGRGAGFNIRPCPFLPTGTWASFLSFLQNGENPTRCVKLPWRLQESTGEGLPMEAGHVDYTRPTFSVF